MDVKPVAAEITYGIERLCMFIQGINNVYDLKWNDKLTYGDVHHQDEVEYSHFNFQHADISLLQELFRSYEQEAQKLLDAGLVRPAYDYVLKCSHTFNLLDARGAISVTERTGYIGRVRNLARQAAEGYLAQREKLGFPLLKEEVKE